MKIIHTIGPLREGGTRIKTIVLSFPPRLAIRNVHVKHMRCRGVHLTNGHFAVWLSSNTSLFYQQQVVPVLVVYVRFGN